MTLLDLETEINEQISNALILEPDLPASRLAPLVIREFSSELRHDLAKMLIEQHVAKLIKQHLK